MIRPRMGGAHPRGRGRNRQPRERSMTSRHLGMLAALAAVIAGPAQATEAAAPAVVPYADFARHEQFREVKISPNGDYLAAAAVVDGKAVLSLIRLSDMKGVNLRPRDT